MQYMAHADCNTFVLTQKGGVLRYLDVRTSPLMMKKKSH
ncbi:hypothetical protein SynRS9907_01177 [Synechococcus sp. RS9907]|nr:hypothetical protein SynRS9907_01177 [Synechococcus sp. RS9907]